MGRWTAPRTPLREKIIQFQTKIQGRSRKNVPQIASCEDIFTPVDANICKFAGQWFRWFDSFLDYSVGVCSVCWASFPGKRSFLGDHVQNSDPPACMNRGQAVRPVSGLTEGHAAAFTGGNAEPHRRHKAEEWAVRRSAPFLRPPWTSGRRLSGVPTTLGQEKEFRHCQRLIQSNGTQPSGRHREPRSDTAEGTLTHQNLLRKGQWPRRTEWLR